MPVLRYIAWVGAGLLTLLFVTDSVVQKAVARIENEPTYKIAVTSRNQGPEAVSFSGENRVFAKLSVAEAAPVTPAAEHVRDAFAKLDETAPEAVAAPAQPRKVAKRKARKPAATDEAQTQQPRSFQTQNVAYSRPFDKPVQPNSFW